MFFLDAGEDIGTALFIFTQLCGHPATEAPVDRRRQTTPQKTDVLLDMAVFYALPDYGRA